MSLPNRGPEVADREGKRPLISDQPSVASHLKIPLEEYDARIRTFIPFYEEMLGVLGSLVDSLAGEVPRILDLGIGTGALAERCLMARPMAELVGIDSDPEILGVARSRLRDRGKVECRSGDFEDSDFPDSDLIVASFSLHHIPEPEGKKRLYRRCRQALGEGGSLLQADCFPPGHELLAEEGMEAWRAHLQMSYTREEALGYLDAWSGEDTYFPLAHELGWMKEAGFQAEVVWRRGLWAVLLCD